ncbi:alpha/beta hydrolase [Halalkalibacter urbisdiaboli]|uniref:alpha/beta hydrolase n=1 Tax=Halalkalibacter urbisdiaboli TaxID=1960589 RepID=UPI000B433867|nr:alpha/beta fold hydrolase [Halalkalibacter urbisdiaboli]
MEERIVSFEHNGSVYGTITKPAAKEKLAAILILPGSGPLDRNGNKGRIKLNLYNQLAEELSKLGYVTFRYDKRGTGKSPENFLKVGFWDLVEEGKAALEFLKDQPFVDEHKLFIIGHSEGAMIAPAVAKHESLAGVILLAGAAETLHEALLSQRKQVVDALNNLGGLKGKLLQLINVTKKIEKQGSKFDQKMLEAKKDVIRIQGARVNAKWFKEHYEYNVREVLQHIKCPVLAVTGSKDLQVTPEKVHDIHELVQTESEAVVIPNMNHILRHQEEDYSILQIKKAYKGSGEKPISPQFIEAINSWLSRYA